MHRYIYICAYMCVQREKEEVVCICAHTHTRRQTCVYICVHTHIYVYEYIFIHLNPVLSSLTVFAAMRRGEASVSQGIGGVPCPPRPLHRPKGTSAFSGLLESSPGSFCSLLKKLLCTQRSPSHTPVGAQALEHSSFSLLLLHFHKHH